MRFFSLLVILGIAALPSQAEFIAEVETDLAATNNTFRINLDYTSAPYAVANFILLAGNDEGIDGDLDADPIVYQGTANTLPPGNYTRGAGDDMSVIAEGNDYALYRGNYKHATLTASGAGYADANETFTLVRENQPGFGMRWFLKTKVSRNWIDTTAGTISQKHFYKNLAFSNISPGNYMAVGSRDGGTFETPGFDLPDEVVRPAYMGNYDHQSIAPFGGLNAFTSPFSVGMLNKGSLAVGQTPRSIQLSSGGAIWFVTLSTQPLFNGRFTHFGTIVNDGGRSVVTAIANSPTPVKIKRITITNALAHSWSPVLTALDEMPNVIRLDNKVTPTTDSGQFKITFPISAGTTSNIFISTDLFNWSPPIPGISLLSHPPGTTSTSYTYSLGYTSSYKSRYAMVGTTKYPKWPSYQMTDWRNAQVNFGSQQVENGTVYAGYSATSKIKHILRLNADGSTGYIQYAVGPYAGTRSVTSASYSPVSPFKGTLTVNISGLGTHIYELYFDGKTLDEKSPLFTSNYVNRYRLLTQYPPYGYGETEFGIWQRTDAGGYYR